MNRTPNERFRTTRLSIPSPSGAPRPMSRQELADKVNDYLWQEHRIKENLTQREIGRIERGAVRWPGEWRRIGFRAVLGAASDQDLGFYFHRSVTVSGSRPKGGPTAAVPLGTQDGGHVATLDTEVLRTGMARSLQPLKVAGGRAFAGSVINARVFPAVDDGRVIASIPTSEPGSWTPGWPGRELLVGTLEHDGHIDAYAVDSRRAGQQAVLTEGRVPIPRAYRLDDITVGLLWAVVNLDTSLLGDDARLADCHEWTGQYEALASSSASRDAFAALSRVSQMWLGSEFCARHILRHCASLGGPPAFWTREQCGEEASTWLLFLHKYEYLKLLAARCHSRAEPMVRTFSLTEAAVVTSPPRERVLLLLAAALMESFGIQVNVCVDTAYRALEGFVLDRQRRSIVANWVDTDAVWHVDVTTSQPDLRRYADALDYGQAHSAIAAATPRGRLMALAGLLDLDWAWLVHRCSQLAAYGAAGIAEPHSRLLSTAGVDRACGYLAAVGQRNG